MNPDNESDCARALEVAVSHIEKPFGKGALMERGENTIVRDLPTISMGSLSLDLALGTGGLPRRRVVEIYGPGASGKTTMALPVITQARTDGGTCASIDAGHALDKGYARELGVKAEEVLVSQPDNGEQALAITDTLVRGGTIDVIATDSVAALVPEAESEGERGEPQIGLQARLMSPALRKLAAIFSADVKGYRRLRGEDEEATLRTVSAYREVMSILIEQYRGRVEDAPGDNLLAEFASVVDAVQCAVEIQRVLKTRNATLLPEHQMEFRIGINLGEVMVEGARIYGDGVNIAARLESLAEAGDICISGIVYDQVEAKLSCLNLEYEYLGEQTVKDIAKPVPVYRLQMEPEHSFPGVRGRGEVSLPFLALPDKPSVAVLSFANMSGDAEQEYFSDGLTEDLITDLSKLSGLFVSSRNSILLYKGRAVKPEQVSKELGVQYMVEGSVRKAGSRVRITAQLIDTTTGYHLWAERYDRELQDIFALQDEVAQKIVAALASKLTEGEQGHFGCTPTASLEAHDCFLGGLGYHAERTQEATAQARCLFERATMLDLQFAAACAKRES
jgi:TolB-like protein/class 3 adenylate cyclase